LVITIDGPVAAGKTSAGRRLATRLGFTLLDTGAIYRSVALVASGAGIDWRDEGQVIDTAEQLKIEFETGDEMNRVFVAGVDVTEAIRTPEISRGASMVSALPGVRTALLALQQRRAIDRNVIAEGRDTGTVVFPAAETKFFLTAGPEVRALRRYRELQDKGIDTALDEVLADLEERDRRDSNRSVAPLVPAPDAIRIDSSDLPIEGVVKRMVEKLPERFAKRPE